MVDTYFADELGAATRLVDLTRYGNATTDVSATVVSALGNGDTPWVPFGKAVLCTGASFTMSDSVPFAHVRVEGKILAARTAPCLTVIGAMATETAIISITDTTLTTNGTAELVTRVEVSSADFATYQVGDIVKRYCNVKMPWTDPTGASPFIGETSRVIAVASGANYYLYFPRGVWTTLISGATTKACSRIKDYDVSITGDGSFEGNGDPDATSYTNPSDCVLLRMIDGARVDARFKDVWGRGLRLQQVSNSSIKARFRGQRNAPASSIYGYGVHEERGCSNNTTEVYGTDGRHLFTTDADDSGASYVSLAPWNHGGPMFGKVSGHVTNTRGCGFDTHQFTGFYTFINCVVEGTRIAPEGTAVGGFQNRGYGNTYIGCRAYNVHLGVDDHSFDQRTGRPFTTTYTGMVIEGTGSHGMQIGNITAGQSAEVNHRLVIKGGSISDVNSGIQFDTKSAGARVSVEGVAISKFTDVPFLMTSDVMLTTQNNSIDYSQTGAARDGAGGNGLVKATGGASNVLAGDVTLANNIIFGSTSRPTNLITFSGTGAVVARFVKGGNKFIDRTGVPTDTLNAGTVTTTIDLDGDQVVALTDATTIATNALNGRSFSVTLAGNRTLGAPTNARPGRVYTWKFTQDATGTRTLAFNAAFLFPGGTDTVLSTAAGAVDVVQFFYDGASFIHLSSNKAVA